MDARLTMAANAHETENPAQLSVELAGLFPPGAVAAELPGNAPVTLLTPSELQSISHCAHKRIQDFTAGRACAHRALRELGITGFSLLSGPDRQPLWPTSISGSITHTNGYRAAVVSYERDLRSVGVDCESIEAVDQDLWSRICAPPELHRLTQLSAAAAQRHAALIFAAKEAFYKCQYPLTKQWVGFEDVVIEPQPGVAESAGFTVVPLKPLALDPALIARLRGRFLFRDRWVIVGIAVARAEVFSNDL
jgi:4'-phosphopantetheinyl transferase EntD